MYRREKAKERRGEASGGNVFQLLMNRRIAAIRSLFLSSLSCRVPEESHEGLQAAGAEDELPVSRRRRARTRPAERSG